MDADDLRVFEAVVRHGSMRRAAEALNTVQSNVTSRIRALEYELGADLFRRHARGVSPTMAAQRLLPYAARVQRVLEDARRAARDDGTPAGALVVGALETTAAIRLAPVLASYAAAHPAVDLSLRTGTTCELVDDALAHRVDGAFVCGPVDHPDLLAETMFQEELVMLTAPGVVESRTGLCRGRPPDRRSAGRVFLPATAGGIAGAAGRGRHPGAGVWHAGGDSRVRGGRNRGDAVAPRAGGNRPAGGAGRCPRAVPGGRVRRHRFRAAAGWLSFKRAVGVHRGCGTCVVNRAGGGLIQRADRSL